MSGACTGQPLSQMVGCAGVPCATLPPVNCMWANWQGWSPCSVGCGQGTQVRGASSFVAAFMPLVQTRTRGYLQPPANGGAPCDGERESSQACTKECSGTCVTNVDCGNQKNIHPGWFVSNRFLA